MNKYKDIIAYTFTITLGVAVAMYSPNNKDIGQALIGGGLALYQPNKKPPEELHDVHSSN